MTGSPISPNPHFANPHSANPRRILIVNDDGIKSPLLKPMVAQLSRLGQVHLVVPSEEQSWKAKSMTRFGKIYAQPVEGMGCPAFAVSGTPADCVNMGVYNLFDAPPHWVVSGVNIGFNWGLNLVLNSGTIGAALEAALVGLPAVAFSCDFPGHLYTEWVTHFTITGAESGPLIANSAAWVGRMMEQVMAQGLPSGAHALNVNFPRRLTLESPVRWARLRDNRYASLFAREEDGGYRHRYMGDAWGDEHPQNDVPLIKSGHITVSPLNISRLGFMPEEDGTPYGL